MSVQLSVKQQLDKLNKAQDANRLQQFNKLSPEQYYQIKQEANEVLNNYKLEQDAIDVFWAYREADSIIISDSEHYTKEAAQNEAEIEFQAQHIEEKVPIVYHANIVLLKFCYNDEGEQIIIQAIPSSVVYVAGGKSDYDEHNINHDLV